MDSEERRGFIINKIEWGIPLRLVMLGAIILMFSSAQAITILEEGNDQAFIDFCYSGCNLTTDSYTNVTDNLWGNVIDSYYRIRRAAPADSTEFNWMHWAAPTNVTGDQVIPTSIGIVATIGSTAGNPSGNIMFSPDNQTWYLLNHTVPVAIGVDLIASSNMTQADAINFINSSGWFHIYLIPNTTAATAGLELRQVIVTADVYDDTGYYITNCTNQNQQKVKTFVFYNETTPSENIPLSMDVAVDMELANGTVLQWGLDLNDNESFSICIFPSTINLSGNITVQYFDGYFQNREYYIPYGRIDNVTETIGLYGLHDAEATLWTINIENEGGTAIQNIYIEVEKYSISENEYYEVAHMRSDQNGEDTTYVDYYDTFYRLNFTDGAGTSYLLTSAAKITTTDITYTLSILGDLDIYSYVDQLTADYIWHGNGNLTVTTTDDSGFMTSTCYLLTEITNGTSETTINDTCIVGSPTTFESVANSSLPHYLSVTMYYGTEQWNVFTDFIEPIASVIYDSIGLLLGTLLALTFAFAGLAAGSVGAIVGFVTGYGVALAVGWIAITDPISNFMGLITLAGITIYFISNRKAIL
jgi:hypothetical protein